MQSLSFELYDHEADLYTMWTIPARFSVCPECQGEGARVNPAIDGHGLSREDFDADPDFERDYFAGVYDQPCPECKGQRVTLAPDPTRASAAEIAAYDRDQREQWQADAADRAEARYFAAFER